MKDITIDIPLKEYFFLKKKANPGFLYLVIDKEQREKIISQEYWDEDFYISPIPLDENSSEDKRLFQLWEKLEWEINSASQIQAAEILQAQKRKSTLETQKRHDEFMARKQVAITFLISKGKSRAEAIKMVEYACNPRVTKTTEFDPETLEEKTTEKVNELDIKIQQKFNLVY